MKIDKVIKEQIDNGVVKETQPSAKMPAEKQLPKYRGLIGTTRTVIAEEGVFTLYNGLTAGIHRQILFSGIRVGSYNHVKELVCGPLGEGQNPALYQKIIAAMITGSVAITVANPTDVVKVRLQN